MDLELHWYVSYVKSCREKSAARSLTALGVENFLPVSTVKRKWSDRIRLVERLLLPHMIFIRTNEIRRVELLKEVDSLTRFMSKGGAYNPVIIPDEQMKAFRLMLEHSPEEVDFVGTPLVPGDRVIVVEGPLAGLECELLTINGSNKIAIKMDWLGASVTEIDISSVKKL